LITNAIDPLDDTRYAENEVEGAGTTKNVLERYRLKVHLLSSSLRAKGDTFDFASVQEFPEVGLNVKVQEWGSGSNASGNFDVVRLRVEWERGAAIDLGFVDSTPDWQSPDIAVIKPEQIQDDGTYEFPEDQNTPEEEVFRVPNEDGEELLHKVAVRVWNFGNATAENVQIGLVTKQPGGSGDWETIPEMSKVLPAPLGPSASDGPQIIDFDWPVTNEFDGHVCFRAQIGDRDVPRDDNGLALASDDTNANNDWAQQNAFIFEAPANSPPEPVQFTHQVLNKGSYVEEVHLQPYGLARGSKVTVSPEKLQISPFSRGLFQIKVELEEHLLKAKCNKDITFVLEAWRRNDDSYERWSGAKYTIKPRFKTTTTLDGSLLPEKLHLYGSISPDVGAQSALLHIQRPGQPSIWEDVPLGPGSTFDYELEEDFPPNDEVSATAYFDGSFEYSKSVSKTFRASWTPAG